jgi:hypothetical protein
MDDQVAATATAVAIARNDPEATAVAVLGIEQDVDANEPVLSSESEEQVAKVESQSSIWPMVVGIFLLAGVVGGGFFVWRYAQKTGSGLPSGVITCPECGMAMSLGARFCTNCGHQMK